MVINERENYKIISDADLVEVIRYPNGGHTSFYRKGDNCYIVDSDVWKMSSAEDVYNYSLLTDKQNAYMKKYKQVYRYIADDLKKDSPETLVSDNTVIGDNIGTKTRDRSQGTDSSPLEMMFEKQFCDVYGNEAVKYLEKEFPVSDGESCFGWRGTYLFS